MGLSNRNPSASQYFKDMRDMLGITNRNILLFMDSVTRFVNRKHTPRSFDNGHWMCLLITPLR